jgi:hypothetical protein
MGTYSYRVTGFTPSTANDTLGLVPASNRRIQLIDTALMGIGTSSASTEQGYFRQTAAGSGTAATAVTAAKWSIDGVAAASSGSTGAWGTTQPTVTAGTALINLGVNANGGIFRWTARPGEEIEFNGRSSDALSMRAITAGAGANWSMYAVEVEDPM